jgi:hypothetical protein
MYMNCELNDAEIWLKSALQEEPGKEVLMLLALSCAPQIGTVIDKLWYIAYAFNTINAASKLLMYCLKLIEEKTINKF